MGALADSIKWLGFLNQHYRNVVGDRIDATTGVTHQTIILHCQYHLSFTFWAGKKLQKWSVNGHCAILTVVEAFSVPPIRHLSRIPCADTRLCLSYGSNAESMDDTQQATLIQHGHPRMARYTPGWSGQIQPPPESQPPLLHALDRNHW